jgi:hypothetical protein
MTERWIDAHSVGCVLCGGMADERRTVNIWPDQIPEGSAIWQENPERAQLIKDIADTAGCGEAHPECFDITLENGLDPTGVDLEPRDHR